MTTRCSRPDSRSRSGFSLLEILVVVSTIALLIAIALPHLIAVRQQARRMLCCANIKALGDGLNFYKTGLGRYPDIGDRDPRLVGTPRNPNLDSIGDVAAAVVYNSLGDPRAMYCPVSLQQDRHARGPYALVPGGKPTPQWQTGPISFFYLVGVGYHPDASSSLSDEDTFPDADGKPTFDPARESPDPRVNRGHGRYVLIGDRTVELAEGQRNIAGSNHGRQGGWFYYVDGAAHWRPWDRLKAHPTRKYIWYWPKTTRGDPKAENQELTPKTSR